MILTVTLNPAVDHTIQIDTKPEANTVVRTDTDRFDAGGKGINVAQYLCALGVDTLATGLVGDFLGRYVEDELTADGIAHDLIEIEGRTRLNTTIVDPDAEYKINHTGPTVAANAVDDVIDVLAEYDPDRVLVAGSLPPGLTTHAIDRIAEAGPWRTAVDLGGEGLSELEATYSLCKPNRDELAAATGMAVDSIEACVAAADELRATGFEWVVTSLGGDGALLVGEREVLHAAALEVDVADTVGAGDAMLAGVLSALDAGADARAALSRGIAVAARMVSVSGTRLPAVDELEADVDRVVITDLSR